MNHYETSSTVGGQGDIHLAGVPFTPGTEVEIVVSAKNPSAAISNDRVGPLLTALDRAANTAPIGALHREELYDRNSLR